MYTKGRDTTTPSYSHDIAMVVRLGNVHAQSSTGLHTSLQITVYGSSATIAYMGEVVMPQAWCCLDTATYPPSPQWVDQEFLHTCTLAVKYYASHAYVPYDVYNSVQWAVWSIFSCFPACDDCRPLSNFTRHVAVSFWPCQHEPSLLSSLQPVPMSIYMLPPKTQSLLRCGVCLVLC